MANQRMNPPPGWRPGDPVPPGVTYNTPTGWRPGQPWPANPQYADFSRGTGPGGITIGIGTGPGTGTGEGTGPTFPGGGIPPIFRAPDPPNPSGPTPTPTPPGATDTPAPDKKKDRDWLDTLKDILLGKSGQQGQGQGSNTLPAIAALARILAGFSKGGAQGRLSEAEQARLYDYLNLARTRTMYDRSGQELDQRKWAQDLQERSYKNSIRASGLTNYAPGRLTPPGELSAFMPALGGGLGAIPQERRDEIGNAMYRNAILELTDPLQPGTGTGGRRMAALPEPDPISPTPEAGTGDNIVNWLGIILSGLAGPQAPPTTAPGTPNAGQAPPPAQPPPPVPAYRSPEATSPPLGDAGAAGLPIIERQGSTALSQPGSGSPLYGASSPSSMDTRNAGLTGGSGLPAISSLAPDLTDPTDLLGQYGAFARQRRA